MVERPVYIYRVYFCKENILDPNFKQLIDEETLVELWEHLKSKWKRSPAALVSSKAPCSLKTSTLYKHNLSDFDFLMISHLTETDLQS